MSLAVDYVWSTLGEHLEQQRSPPLQPSTLNFETTSTPPPLVDAPDWYEPESTDQTPRRVSKGKPQPSLSDALLIRSLGPLYPEVADRAGIELPVDDPDSPCEDRRPDIADDQLPMIVLNHQKDVSTTSDQHKYAHTQALTASREASSKLNDAIISRSGNLTIDPHGPGHRGVTTLHDRYTYHDRRDKRHVSISIANLTTDEVSLLSLHSSSPPEDAVDIQTLSRSSLPSLQTSTSPLIQAHHRHDSISSSGPLAPFTITPAESHPSQTLPRLQNHISPLSIAAQPLQSRQTLPSLETALTSATDSKGSPYLEASPALSRPSPGQHSQYGLSPAAYHTPIAVMSPPRLPSNPIAWRTLSHNSSTSTTSENASSQGSGNSATPGTRLSPSQSVSTPLLYPASEHESGSDVDMGRNGEQSDTHGQHSGGSQQGYSCAFPGCSAPPFQTQYLLNSHTNVHSNQRPHFCPVEGCPRGPGGQGFKRKNEMIRHGLVHQSPGYVCPFCSDQQHKYPRPDNLQRHVRVHHTEKDRDDPLLREVLAQRPEGGNRGRRRRLGG